VPRERPVAVDSVPAPRPPELVPRLLPVLGAAALLLAGVGAAALLTRQPQTSTLAAGPQSAPGASIAAAVTAAIAASPAIVEGRVLAELGTLPATAQFLDPATGLPRTNTVIRCTHTGRGTFVCVVSALPIRPVRLRVRAVGNRIRISSAR
jgi:hypothetical protein